MSWKGWVKDSRQEEHRRQQEHWFFDSNDKWLVSYLECSTSLFAPAYFPIISPR